MNDPVSAYIRGHYLNARAQNRSRAVFIDELKTTHPDPSHLIDEVIRADMKCYNWFWLRDNTHSPGLPYTRAFDVSRGDIISCVGHDIVIDIQVQDKHHRDTPKPLPGERYQMEKLSKDKYRECLHRLTDVERRVITLRTNADGGPRAFTLAESAAKLLLTRDRVRVIEKNAQKALFEMVGDMHPNKDPEIIQEMLQYHWENKKERTRHPQWAIDKLTNEYPQAQTREQKEKLAESLGISLTKMYNLASRLRLIGSSGGIVGIKGGLLSINLIRDEKLVSYKDLKLSDIAVVNMYDGAIWGEIVGISKIGSGTVA